MFSDQMGDDKQEPWIQFQSISILGNHAFTVFPLSWKQRNLYNYQNEMRDRGRLRGAPCALSLDPTYI